MRGLKLWLIDTVAPAMKSHLLQMRGLKHFLSLSTLLIRMSHLLQMRGLKQLTKAQAEYTEVASFTDAWIETFVPRRLPCMTAVASFTDAWIETRVVVPRLE